MPRFDPLAYRDPHPVPWLIRALGPIVRHLVLPGVVKLRAIDLPEADLARLRHAVRPATAAFIGPSHPEFFTDWMLDKEISRLASPLMAHWATWEIVNMNAVVQPVWLWNNLIANAPGGGGKEYSVRWALRGHGVLLHPEGNASWHGDEIGPLVPGIVDLAWETCRRARANGESREVLVVPVVWKLHFTRDVSRGLAREMALIERALGLPEAPAPAVEKRFEALQWNLLRARARKFEFTLPAESGGGAEFFSAQSAFAAHLLARLEAKYRSGDGDVQRQLHLLRRAIRARFPEMSAEGRRDRATVAEIERLGTFSAERYGGDTLAQEHIAENLKRVRTSVVTRGFKNSVHTVVPVAVAERVAHIRIPEPIAVHERWTDNGEVEARAALLSELRVTMQRALDGLLAEVAPAVDPFRRPNPFRLSPGAR